MIIGVKHAGTDIHVNANAITCVVISDEGKKVEVFTTNGSFPLEGEAVDEFLSQWAFYLQVVNAQYRPKNMVAPPGIIMPGGRPQ